MSLGYGGIGAGGPAGWGNNITGEQFPDPFADYASLVMPETMSLALRWCEYIFLAQGTYREATRRLLSYFITDVELQGASDNVKDNWKEFLDETLDIKNVLHIVGLDAMCFQGDTRAVTRDGVFPLRELAGKTVEVLSSGGVYRKAEFKSFGTQELLEVEFGDDRKVLATPNHQWFARNRCGHLVKVQTKDLLPGYRIERVVAPRPSRDEDYREGVRHGLGFDRPAPDDCEELDAFRDVSVGGVATRVSPRVSRYRSLPAAGVSASYWYGFVCGLVAATGSVDTQGRVQVTLTRSGVLGEIAEQLPRVGMVAGSLRDRGGARAGHVLTLVKKFLVEDDLLLEKHRDRFAAAPEAPEYDRYVRVRAVRPTGRVEEVFCCVEPETHAFVIENALVTSNCYGNSFTSVIPTFTRYVLCPQCKAVEKPLRQMMDEPVFRFKWSNYKFHADCPKCKYSGAWKFYDRPSGQHNGFRIKRWNPHDIELLWEPWTDEIKYIWKIPEEYRRQVREGKNPLVLEQVPPQVIKAVENNNHLLFERDFIHHMREDALAGVNNRGWGISRVLANFRQAWYVQVLHRYNEAIALDYVIPFRLITPVPGDKSSGADPLVGMNMGGYMSQVHQMLRRRRYNPAGWNTLPFPVQYQAIGGDAKAMAPDTLLNQGNEELLNNLGVPAELYRASLTVQAMPAALRLFEASNSSIPHNFNSFLRFVVRKVGGMLRWEPVTAKLQKVTHADDASRQMTKLQLATSGMASQTTGLRAVGLEYKDEVRQMMDDQKYQADQQMELQEQMDQSAQMKDMQNPQPQQAPGGGDPAAQGGAGAQPGMAPQSVVAGLPQGPNQQVTPEELLSRAQYVASQLMGMPESQKDSELIKLKKVDPTLHALVRGQMNDMRQQMRTQGGAAMQAQTYGKQGAARDVQKKASALLARLRRRIDLD